MRAVGILLGVAALALIVWFVLRGPAAELAVDSGRLVAESPLDAAPKDAEVRLDAVRLPPQPPPPPPAPADVIAAETDGLMFREADWIERMAPLGWRATAGSWQSPLGTVVTFAIREGRVVGARITLHDTAMSSAITELSVPLIGHQGGGGDQLPGGPLGESLTVEAAPRTGTVKGPGGEQDWALWLRTTGEPPYGPARFDLGDVGPLDGSVGPGP